MVEQRIPELKMVDFELFPFFIYTCFSLFYSEEKKGYRCDVTCDGHIMSWSQSQDYMMQRRVQKVLKYDDVI